jgi:hypothetical protein
LVELIYQSFLILDLLVGISAEDIGSACYQFPLPFIDLGRVDLRGLLALLQI